MSALKFRRCFDFMMLRFEARDFTPYSLVRILGTTSLLPLSERRTILHFDVSTISNPAPTTFLDVPVANLDVGPPFGTIDLYSFEGDGTVSVDEWNAGTLVHTFTDIDGVFINGIGNVTVLSVDVTSLLQQAVNDFAPFLSFNLREPAPSKDRFSLSVAGLPAPSLNARAPLPGPVNVALASNGSTVFASSTHNSGYGPEFVINGDRRGLSWEAGGGWNDATFASYPDSLEVHFDGIKTIQEIDVFTLQDNYNTPVEPAAALPFSLFGMTDFRVQYWNGTDWFDVPNGVITGNNLVWRKISFAPISTTAIRVVVQHALGGFSRITEIEAWTSGAVNNPPIVSVSVPGSPFTAPATIQLSATANDTDGSIARVDFYSGTTLIATSSSTTNPFTADWNNVSSGNYFITAVATDYQGGTTRSFLPVIITVAGGPTNVALASNGAVVVASSSFNSSYPASGVINGDRLGLAWAAGGGWNDLTPESYPNWLEVDFSEVKAIQEIDVFTLQDNFTSPSAPTPSMTFTLYGIKDFQVQYWNGSQWLDVPGGLVTGNNLVWRKFIFAPVVTTRIRVLVNGAGNGYSRITEIEAYSVP